MSEPDDHKPAEGDAETGKPEHTPEHTPERKPERDPADIPPPPGARPFLLVALIGLGVIGYGGYGHWQKNAAAEETQSKIVNQVPRLRAVAVERADAPIELTLPGQTEAFNIARLYARATGYIAERHVDIGSRVKAGDRLLRIAAPDLDQQLAQGEAQLGQLQAQLLRAKAGVDQAKANVNLANVTNSRTSTLAGQGWASRQNADNTQASLLGQTASLASAEADVKVAEANIKAQQATVDRLKVLASFEIVTAPFDGVITTRNVDVGDLVQADAGGGTALFSMARDDLLRISVNVPQNQTQGVQPGIYATIRAPQIPGREFAGTVERSSAALLYSSRTLTTQVDVPNGDLVLRAGLYVYVTLKIPRVTPSFKIPAESMVFNQHGTQVAVANPDGTVTWRKVHIQRDLGTSLEIDQGLESGEKIIVSPPIGLRDRQKIELQPTDDGKGESTPMKSAAR